MKLDDVYPYWPATHDELVDRLRYISDEQWNMPPPGAHGGSIRLIVFRFLNFERFWIQQIAQGRPFEPLRASDLQDRNAYISELDAVRATTSAYMNILPPEELRSVRVAPADPAANEIERNVHLSWILWRVLEEELMAYGQIRALIELTTPNHSPRFKKG
jgi:hypothetical protein